MTDCLLWIKKRELFGWIPEEEDGLDAMHPVYGARAFPDVYKLIPEHLHSRITSAYREFATAMREVEDYES